MEKHSFLTKPRKTWGPSGPCHGPKTVEAKQRFAGSSFVCISFLMERAGEDTGPYAFDQTPENLRIFWSLPRS